MTVQTVAIYIRLSLEDGDLSSSGKVESESITNQRNMLTAFVQNAPELQGAQILEFNDDGYSGKNFDRPGVTRLIQAARNGGIQCIVVKDISRFGRDYITVGNYISRVFPFLGVRFIAVNDHFDSARKGDIDSLDTAFKTLIYDMYSRDISQKVKSAKKQLVERGVYINPVPVFGYRKAPGDKHQIIPDPDAGETVKRIFTMAAEGVKTREIATALNHDQTPTPSARKRGTSGAHANWRENNFWTQRMVSELIRDYQYTGSLVWGKRVRPQIGQHSQLTTRVEDRTILPGHHEALVSEELFEKAQMTLGGAYRPTSKHVRRDYPLRGKIYCGVCGQKLSRKACSRPYYRCDTPTTLPESTCCREKIFEAELIDMVTELIRKQAQCVVDAEQLMRTRREQDKMQVRSFQKELRCMETQYGQLISYGEQLYEKLVDETLTKECFLKEKAKAVGRQDDVKAQMEELRQNILDAEANQAQDVERYGKYVNLECLTTEIAADLVDRITIYANGELHVRLNYINEVKTGRNVQ